MEKGEMGGNTKVKKLELPDFVTRNTDTRHILVGGMPHSLIGNGMAADLFAHLIRTIGPGMAGRFFYDSSKEYICDLQSNLIRLHGTTFTEEKLLDNLSNLPFYLSTYGYGTGEVVIDAENKSLLVKMQNSFIAEELKDEGFDKPVCYYLAGAIAGIAEACAGTEYSCIETKCIANGDPHCEFELSPGSLSDKLYNGAKNGVK